MTLQDRADAFATAFPEYAERGARLQVAGDRITGVWFLGNDYKNKSRMYGALPPAFNMRVFSLFSDAKRILHLFSGSLTAEQVDDAWTKGVKTTGTVAGAAVPPPDATTRWIPLTQGRVTLVDAADFEVLSKWTWHFATRGFARRSEGADGKVAMHRQIMGAPEGVEVDHVNGDPLDNRRCNLRLATHAENSRNTRLASNNTSGYKGVAWNARREKWLAYITVNDERHYLGCDYEMAEEAARAYDHAAREAFGQFARVNFPLPPTQIRLDSGLHPAARNAKPDIIGDAENLSAIWREAYIPSADDREHLPPAAHANFDLVIADPPYRKADMRRYWREAMHALEVPCAECGLHAALHKPRYQRGTRAGALVVELGKLPHEFRGDGYVRFKPLNKKRVINELASVVRPGGHVVWLDEIWPIHSKREFRTVGMIQIVRCIGHRVRALTILERV